MREVVVVAVEVAGCWARLRKGPGEEEEKRLLLKKTRRMKEGRKKERERGRERRTKKRRKKKGERRKEEREERGVNGSMGQSIMALIQSITMNRKRTSQERVSPLPWALEDKGKGREKRVDAHESTPRACVSSSLSLSFRNRYMA